MSEQALSSNRIVRIYRAMRELVRDKEDTKQVFIILEALGRGAAARSFRKFMASPHCERILSSDKILLDYLSDRNYLQKLPEGSLGRTYFKFTHAENLTADGLVEASEEGRFEQREMSEEQQRFHTRNRDAHDLWHVVTGYGRDPLGELSLLAFTFKQMGNWGFLVIIGVGLKVMRGHAPGISIWPAIREGFKMGGQAKWLGDAIWEDLLARPLDEVRHELGIGKPARYRQTSREIQQVLAPA